MSCSCALSMDGTIAFESFGVIRKPLAPKDIRFSIASTCASLSPSCLPAKLCNSTPCVLAAPWAPFLICTKNGLVSVLVISPTTSSPEPRLQAAAVPSASNSTQQVVTVLDLVGSRMPPPNRLSIIAAKQVDDRVHNMSTMCFDYVALGDRAPRARSGTWCRTG